MTSGPLVSHEPSGSYDMPHPGHFFVGAVEL